MSASRLRFLATAVHLTCWAAFGSGVAAESTSVPSLALAGPYGHPLLLAPSGGTGPGLPLLRFEQGTSGRRSSAAIPRAGMTPRSGTAPRSRDLDDDDDDEDAPIRPGSLPTSFPKLPDPAPFAKRRSIGPHLLPDLSFEATERASLGILGNSARLDGRTTPSVTLPASAARLGGSGIAARQVAAPATTAKPRDVGVGLSFQYRFGQ